MVYAANNSIRYFYDKVGRVTNANDSIAGNIRLTYDSLDRLTQEFNNNGTVSYGYNDVGLRTNMTVTGENTVFYKYDNANRLTNVTQGTFTTSLFYDDGGRRTKMILPNGINVLYSYDKASRLTNITYQGTVTNKIDYAYDEAGNRVAQASLLANYLLPAAVTNSSYNEANQQLVFGSHSMLYDANGNVTNIISGTTTNRLFWSARNQLTNMLGAVTATFAYDGLGRRITRTVSGATEKYLYDGLDIIIQKDSANNVRGRYFRGLGIDEPWQRIDITPAQGQQTTSTNRIYLADALGSIVALTDSNKVIQTEYDYEPFGATTTTGAGNKNAYKFTGREDDGTGLYYYRARYYDPVLGRFVSEDPLEGVLRVLAEAVTKSTGDNNIFAYSFDSPIMFTDPLGLWTFSFGTVLSGGAGAGGQGFTGIAFSYSADCGFQIGGITTAGIGGYAGVGGGVEAQFGLSRNRSIADLAGLSGEVGVGGGQGVVAGANVNFPQSGAAPVYSGSVGLGGGLVPVEAHAFANWTRVDQWWSSRRNGKCGCQ